MGTDPMHAPRRGGSILRSVRAPAIWPEFGVGHPFTLSPEANLQTVDQRELYQTLSLPSMQ